MEFGNFKKLIITFSFLLIGNGLLCAQEKTKTTQFLYTQLDYFLENPSTTGLLRLSKIISTKEDQLLTSSDQLAWIIVNVNIGYYQNQYGNTVTAVRYYEKAWKTYNESKSTDYEIIENCLQPLGDLYIKIGDLQKAENTITNYLFMVEKSSNTPKIIAALIDLSIAYNNKGNYEKAIKILEKAETLDRRNVNVFTNLATNYLDTGNYSTARIYAQKVLSLDLSQVNAHQILAAAALESNDLKSAKEYALQAKFQMLKDTKTSARDFSKWQLGYIDILLAKSEFNEASHNLQELYTALIPDYDRKDELPKTEKLITDKILLKALDIHAYVYQELNKPLLAIEAFDLSFLVNSKLNSMYPLQDTKILQHTQNRNRSERYIALLYSLYEKTNDTIYLAKALEATEVSKAPFFNEFLISEQLLSQYKNDSLVNKRNKLSNELSIYDTFILKEKQKGNQAAIEQIQQWIEEYNAKSIELKELNEELAQRYPDFLGEKEKISVEALQEKLNDDRLTLIEYFYGTENIYQFIVTGDSITLNRIKDIDQFRNITQNYIHYFDDASMITDNINGFSTSSFNCYKSLQIPKAKKIIIIPDGSLNFIPFESLLTRKTNTLNFEKMPFLIQKSEISYDISATKYLRSESTNNTEDSILGLFPVDENNTSKLSFSLEEVKIVQQQFKGLFLEKEQATYANFLKEAENYGIIHFSTHADAGDFSRPGSIRFSDQEVLINQLYGLQLDSELAVLTDCDTGIGKPAKGEGPLSIGRGFQYAGIPNILFSLWKVNNKTTSHLLSDFYKNLKKSNSNNHALHTAKLKYLTSTTISNAQKSPYYWATFVYYGSYQPPVETSYFWIIVAGVFLLIIVLLFVIRQKRK
ncbi:CHAT domain-containing protein [Aquimarina addita]